MSTLDVSSIPSYVALQSKANGQYLTIHLDNNVPYNTFSVKDGNTRLTTYEILRVAGDKDTVMIRSPNGHFWRRNSDDWILADRRDNPDPTDKAFQFKLTQIESNVVTFQSKVDNIYLKAYTAQRLTYGLKAATKTLDEWCPIKVANAQNSVVTLPRYAFLEGENGKYLTVHNHSNENWLNFEGSETDIYGVHEVVPHVNGSLLIRSVKADRFWTLVSNSAWILASSNYDNAVKDKNCQFEPTQTGLNRVALKSLGNNKFVKRYTAENIVSGLNALADNPNETFAQLRVSAALGPAKN